MARTEVKVYVLVCQRDLPTQSDCTVFHVYVMNVQIHHIHVKFSETVQTATKKDSLGLCHSYDGTGIPDRVYHR